MSEEPGVVVRAATPADAAAIAALAAEFAAYLRSLGDDAPFALDAAAFVRDGFGASPAFGGLVAEVGGAVAGYLLHYPGYDADLARRVVHVADLFVAPRARGRGAGRALMDRVVAVCREGGGAEVVWSVWRANAPAFAFYERLGARRCPDLALMRLPVGHRQR